MKLIVILCLVFAVAVSPLDWSATKSFEDGQRISESDQLHMEASARITNGNKAAPKQFPYQVGLFRYNETVLRCGGSIISNRWVLTAAHCTENVFTGLYVYLGAWNYEDSTEPNQHRIFVSTKHIILHEEWDEMRSVNDISLIKLPVVIEFNEYIQPVNLPKKSETYPTYAGEVTLVSGWGRVAIRENHRSLLRWIQAPVLTNKMCKGRLWPISVKSTHICIGTTVGISPCHGDSGGPMVLADGSRTLIGITSFISNANCERNQRTIFTRTTSYLDWIAEKTGVVNN